MQVMTIEQRKRIQEQYAQAVKPWNGQAWKPQISGEERRKQEQDVKAGILPF